MSTTQGSETTAVRVNGKTIVVRSRRVSDLLCELGHDPERPGIAVSVNEEVIPRARWGEIAVHNGDRVEIVGAVQGG